MSDLHDKARGLATYLSVCDGDKTSAGIVRDLLADNERLLNALRQANNATLRAISETHKAEARFRALCEAEPVAVHSGYGVLHWIAGCELPPIGTALIPRPSMEGKP